MFTIFWKGNLSMSFRIHTDGSVEGSTIEETIALHRALTSPANGPVPHERKPPSSGPRPPTSGKPAAAQDSAWPTFVKALTEPQRAILRKIRLISPEWKEPAAAKA